MTTEITVPCWCCERPTEATRLVVDIPRALHEQLTEWVLEQETTPSAVVQEALCLLLMPPKKGEDDA